MVPYWLPVTHLQILKTWESWQNADIPVRLEPGNHVVRLSSIGSSGPNVDYLAILNTDEAPNFTFANARFISFRQAVAGQRGLAPCGRQRV